MRTLNHIAFEFILMENQKLSFAFMKKGIISNMTLRSTSRVLHIKTRICIVKVKNGT